MPIHEDGSYTVQMRHTYTIRPDMMAAIHRYVDQYIKPGDFLTAVICGDYKTALARADDENFRNIQAYAMYFYNEVPSVCHGSREAMDAWLARRELAQRDETVNG